MRRKRFPFLGHLGRAFRGLLVVLAAAVAHQAQPLDSCSPHFSSSAAAAGLFVSHIQISPHNTSDAAAAAVGLVLHAQISPHLLAQLHSTHPARLPPHSVWLKLDSGSDLGWLLWSRYAHRRLRYPCGRLRGCGRCARLSAGKGVGRGDQSSDYSYE